MREILFRGKTIDSNEWTYGYYLKGKDKTYIAIKEGESEAGWDIEEVIPETVGQYTGLKDKNGKMIFEGDIVTGLFNYNKITGYIKYGSDCTFYIERNGLYGILLNNAEDWLEVIGNIYGNPELILDHEGKQ
jgi:uncharacterized phage protein (TIGR01671 family)